jgi:hypothetical protein
MHCRVSCSTGPSLPVLEGSGVATWPATLDPASLHGKAPGPPRGTRPHLPARRAPGPPHVPWHPDPASLLEGLRSHSASYGTGPHLRAWEGSEVTTCPATHGKWIKKYPPTTIRLEGSLVTEERSPGPRHLQDAWAGGDIMAYKACKSRSYSACYSDKPPGRHHGL